MWNYSLVFYLAALMWWGGPPANPRQDPFVHPDGQVVSAAATNPTEIGPIGDVADPKGK